MSEFLSLFMAPPKADPPAPRAGDTVLHRPSGETWIAGRVTGERLTPFGWPRSIARVADCEVIERCNDARHAEATAIAAHWSEG
jgi:hypothetical protein